MLNTNIFHIVSAVCFLVTLNFLLELNNLYNYIVLVQ